MTDPEVHHGPDPAADSRPADKDAVISSVIPPEAPARNKGSKADLCAAYIAALATFLALVTAIIFFAGFLENDSYFNAVLAAFMLSAGLGIFALGPSIMIARIAWRAYRYGGTRRSAVLALLLALPWTVLSALCWLYTPLPKWISATAFILALFLTAWAFASIFLLKARPKPYG